MKYLILLGKLIFLPITLIIMLIAALLFTFMSWGLMSYTENFLSMWEDYWKI